MPSPLLSAPAAMSLKLLAIILGTWITGTAGPVEYIRDVSYKSGSHLSADEKERCKLDLVLPTGVRNFPIIVWFHGGGLRAGDKGSNRALFEKLAGRGIAVAAPNYRLSPQAKFPAYVEDAATAVAWVHQNVAELQGDPARVFISGHSAGGYLATMLGLDARYLAAAGMSLPEVAGLLPVAGQTVVHTTIMDERGLPPGTVRVDEAASLHHVKAAVPAILVICGGDDDASRVAENELLGAKLVDAGHADVTTLVVPGRTHRTIVSSMINPEDPAFEAMVDFLASH